MFKKNEFKTLGIINDDQKQHSWTHNVSGSRLKRIIDPNERVKEYLIAVGLRPKDEIVGETSLSKVKFGNRLEDLIVNSFAEDSGYFDRVVIDKRTFITLDKEYYDQTIDESRVSANIDAFIITEEGYQKWKNKEITDEERINYVERIIEVKNTTTSPESLLENYTKQAQFYTWFFNAQKNPYLVYLQNGWSLNYIEIPFNREEFEKDLIIAKEWINCVALKTQPIVALDLFEEETNLTLNEEDILLKQYKEVEDKLKELDVQKKYLKAQIESIFNQHAPNAKKAVLANSQLALSLTKVIKKGTKQWESLVNENNMNWINAHTKLKQELGINLEDYLTLKIEPEVGESTSYILFKWLNNKKAVN